MEDKIMSNPKFVIIAQDFDNGEAQTLGMIYNTLEKAIETVLNQFEAYAEGEVTEEQREAYKQELATNLFLGKDDVEQEIDWSFKIEIMDLEEEE